MKTYTDEAKRQILKEDGRLKNGEPVRRYSPEERAEFLKIWRDSGLNKSEFARQNAVKLNSSRFGLVSQLLKAEKEETAAQLRQPEPRPEAAPKRGRPSKSVVISSNGTGGEHLYCCGADILAELGKLVMKLRALQSISF